MQNKIKEYRKKLNITQLQLAFIVDCAESEIRNIEKNRTIPNIEIAIKIKKALNVKDIEDLFII